MFCKKLVQFLALRRRECGFTQQQIADELHYTQSAIGAFEQGRNDSFTFCQYYMDKFCNDDDIIKIIRGYYDDRK